MFVKFSCGCLGLVNVPGDEEGGNRAVVLSPCGLNSQDCWEPICIWRRDLSDKPYEPMAPKRVAELLSEMGSLISEGYRFRNLKSLLKSEAASGI